VTEEEEIETEIETTGTEIVIEIGIDTAIVTDIGTVIEIGIGIEDQDDRDLDQGTDIADAVQHLLALQTVIEMKSEARKISLLVVITTTKVQRIKKREKREKM